MQKLVTLYAAAEQMHSVEVQRTSAAVFVAEQAIEADRDAFRASGLDVREALAEADTLGRLLADTKQETMEWRLRRLKLVQTERAELYERAREQYVASRLKREQIKCIMEDLGRRMEAEEKRRVQITSDDRFLIRRRWSDMHARGPLERQVKTY